MRTGPDPAPIKPALREAGDRRLAECGLCGLKTSPGSAARRLKVDRSPWDTARGAPRPALTTPRPRAPGSSNAQHVSRIPLPRRRSSVIAAVVQASTRTERLPFPARTPFVVAAERAAQLELAASDASDAGDHVAHLCKRTLQVVEEILREAAKLSAAYDDDGAARAGVDDGAAPARSPLRDIVDVAYMSGWTLHRKRASLLDAVAGGDLWRMASECSSAKRAALRAAVAIERAIAAGLRVASELFHHVVNDVERGVRTRALYRAFRAEIRPDDPPGERTIESRMRAAMIALTKVCEDRHHEDIRLQDRVLFHERRRSVARWMSLHRRPDTTRDVIAEGLRQWKDIAAFAECLRMINLRPELQEHDDGAARAALESLAGYEDAAPLDDGALDALGSLLGRDDGLDAILLSRGPRLVSELRAALERLG